MGSDAVDTATPTSTHRVSKDAIRRGLRTAGRAGVRALAGALVGAMPGIVLILIAEFLVDGEMQLTVGAPGILLAVAGAIIGLGLGIHGRFPSTAGRHRAEPR